MGNIVVYSTKLKTKHILDKRYFELKPKGKAVWLQKLCFKILDKLKCHALVPNDYVERIVIDPPKVIDRIVKQHIEVLNQGHPNKMEIFIGPGQLDGFRLDNQDFMTFTAPVGYNNQIMGMDVTVVPWLEGVLVVPKDRNRLN